MNDTFHHTVNNDFKNQFNVFTQFSYQKQYNLLTKYLQISTIKINFRYFARQNIWLMLQIKNLSDITVITK